MDTQWKPLYGYENVYEICTDSRIRNIKTGKILKPYINENGYIVIRLYDANGVSKIQRVHRLLMLTFVGPDPDRPIVNHKNGKKLDIGLDNLEWCTSSYNNKHAFNTGLKNVDYLKHQIHITVDGLDFVALGNVEAARILHSHGYFTDISVPSLKTALGSCAKKHALYNGIVRCEYLDDPYDTPVEYHRCGIKGREIRAKLHCGLTLKAKGPANLYDKMQQLGYWVGSDRKRMVQRISHAALANSKCDGIRVWYI